jgi:hypothetical protein
MEKFSESMNRYRVLRQMYINLNEENIYSHEDY